MLTSSCGETSRLAEERTRHGEYWVCQETSCSGEQGMWRRSKHHSDLISYQIKQQQNKGATFAQGELFARFFFVTDVTSKRDNLWRAIVSISTFDWTVWIGKFLSTSTKCLRTWRVFYVVWLQFEPMKNTVNKCPISSYLPAWRRPSFGLSRNILEVEIAWKSYC